MYNLSVLKNWDNTRFENISKFVEEFNLLHGLCQIYVSILFWLRYTKCSWNETFKR